ncbi:hypothetical protein [Pseudoalteromonas aurantia]|uniref:Uncharacterized protein n=1 Tax=Pseudoalteromonas aurantia TaxID=43654 RepID=A0A5S3VC41_9GAMM|nr:hypothetical protein [Pseudoalteromonas aurantia]TMO69073.1 hypothetical protein CWC19_06460 [Pseudoalteromonas aurantia]
MNDDKQPTLHALGIRYGLHDADSPTPLDNVLAISAWHSALGRMIAYTWKNWDNDQELSYIVKFPEYYLAKFGFFPQIPAYQTKVRFVIKKGDSVKFTHGDNSEGGKVEAISQSNDADKIVQQLRPSPSYIYEHAEYPTTPDIQSVTSILGDEENPTDAKIKQKLADLLGLKLANENADLPALHNGWHFDNLNELTGCFIVTIPPKPNLSHIEDNGQKSMIESQAISDFMDICRSQPFTSC